MQETLHSWLISATKKNILNSRVI